MSGVVLAVAMKIFPDSVMICFVVAFIVLTEESNRYIVMVRAVALNYLTEKTFLDHTESHHLVSAVAAVLQHHYGDTGLLVDSYKVVAFGDIESTAHLYGGVLSRSHSLDGVLYSGIPTGHVKHGVYLGICKYLLVI